VEDKCCPAYDVGIVDPFEDTKDCRLEDIFQLPAHRRWLNREVHMDANSSTARALALIVCCACRDNKIH